MEFLSIVPWGLVAILVTLAGNGIMSYRAHVKFVTRTELVIDGLKVSLDEKVSDTNRRVSDLGAGSVGTQTELRDFKEHVSRHFVEKDEIADLRSSIDKSIERMQSSLELATSTMSDVRDSVIALTARAGKSTVPPARRRTPKAGV